MTSHFNIVDIFFQTAKKYPEKKAIIAHGKSVTFAELSLQVHNTVHYFQKKGLKKNDRVLVFVPMGIDLYRVVLALFYMGATAVFLDEWAGLSRLNTCCMLAQCKGYIAAGKARLLTFFSSEIRKIPIKLSTEITKYPSGNAEIPHTTFSDTALITFTTGSTGMPKAAKRTHGFLKEQFEALLDKIEPKPEDIDMPLLPIVLLINLGVGCTSIIADYNARKPEKMNTGIIYRQLVDYKITRVVSSPFFVLQLGQYLINKQLSLPDIRQVFTGGAPVFPNQARILNNAFPSASVEIVYGSTEAEPISSISAKELQHSTWPQLKDGLMVGIPYKKTSVVIIPLTNKTIEVEKENELRKMNLPPGSIGEIIVSGPHVLKEYFNNDLAFKRNKIVTDSNCWHRTGDSGFLKEGMLYLTGRCSTLFEHEGKTISPFTYENLLQTQKNIIKGTIIKINGIMVLFIEIRPYNNKTKNESLKRIKELGIQYNKIKFLKKIPTDPRHKSKIDYEKLSVSDF